MFKSYFLSLWMFCLFSSLAYAQIQSNMDDVVRETVQEASGLNRASMHLAENFNSQNVFDKAWSPDVSMDKNQLKQDALNQMKNSEFGKALSAHVENREKIVIAKTDPLFDAAKAAAISAQILLTKPGDYYGMEAHGIDHGYVKSHDFERGIAELSAAKDASKQFEGGFIFRGHPMRCRDAAGNFSDCCLEQGWGNDLNLSGCDEEEKQLAKSRQQGLTIYVGRYCAKRLLGRCLKYRQTFCVFNSKLARLIQEQGRVGQLGLSFGNVEYPDCSGITPSQLQQMNFKAMDLHAYYSDLHPQSNDSDLKLIQDRINQQIAG